MSELAPADPEAPYPSLTVLHDAAQQSFGDPHDPSVLEVQRSLLWGILQKAIDGQVNSRAQAAIFNYGEIVDYLWFQPSDAPLPRGLARSEAIYIPGRPDYKDLC